MLVYYPFIDPIPVHDDTHPHKFQNILRVLLSNHLHKNIRDRAEKENLKLLHGIDLFKDIDDTHHVQPVGLIVGRHDKTRRFADKHESYLNDVLMHRFSIADPSHLSLPEDYKTKRLIRLHAIRFNLGDDPHHTIHKVVDAARKHDLPQTLILAGSKSGIVMPIHGITDWYAEEEQPPSKKHIKSLADSIDDKINQFKGELSNTIGNKSVTGHKKFSVVTLP